MHAIKKFPQLKIAVAALLVAIPSAWAEQPHYLTIKNDRGGMVVEYAVQAREIDRSGRIVRFAGSCLSACTLYLSAARTCVTPEASFGFHLPYGSSSAGNRTAAAFLYRSYPDWVKDWISDNGGLGRQIKTMTYEYAARHLPSCTA
jgi:hypothetical protein